MSTNIIMVTRVNPFIAIFFSFPLSQLPLSRLLCILAAQLFLCDAAASSVHVPLSPPRSCPAARVIKIDSWNYEAASELRRSEQGRGKEMRRTGTRASEAKMLAPVDLPPLPSCPLSRKFLSFGQSPPPQKSGQTVKRQEV